MPDAPNPTVAPQIDWTNLSQLIGPLLPMLLPMLQSIIKKSQYAKAHVMRDPLESLAAFVDDYAAVHKAMAAGQPK